MKQVKLLRNMVLIKPDKKKDITESGIILSKKNDDPMTVGTVVGIGPGIRNNNNEKIPMEVSVGDRVMYRAYVGTEVEFETEQDKYILLTEKDIYCILI